MRTAFVVIVTGLALAHAQTKAPKFEKLYPQKPDEGVFAYARISPDGNTIAYASEMPAPNMPRGITQTVTVVDLKTKKVVFEEPGIDAYWSNDGTRMIYSSFLNPNRTNVTMRHHPSGELVRSVIPDGYGDYYSWSTRNGKEQITTITSNYYNLDGDKAVLPVSHVNSCPGIGTGDRPLANHDGTRITTFVRGTVVVRGIDNCDDIFDTGLPGAKADFSFDGKYIAFHVPRRNSAGSDIVVIDVKDHTMRNVTASLPGSSLFPSWTKDGRLCFRYEGADYRGFMMASDVLSAPAQAMPSPSPSAQLPANRVWKDLFPESKLPSHKYELVMIWGTWSAHSPGSLADLQTAQNYFADRGIDIGVATALEPGTLRADADRIIRQNGITLPELPLTPAHFRMTEARNQIPSTLLFEDGKLVDRRLGPPTLASLKEWIGGSYGK